MCLLRSKCIPLLTFFVIFLQRDTSSYLDIITVLDEAIQSHTGKETIRIEFHVSFDYCLDHLIFELWIFSMGPILFSYYEESLVSSKLNSKTILVS